MPQPQWIMISGPYTTGALTPEDRAHNLQKLNQAAIEVFRKGHIPIVGVNMGLPMCAATHEDIFDEIMMPLCLALARKCDAVLRLEGASMGGDQEVAVIQAQGGRVYTSLEEIPSLK